MNWFLNKCLGPDGELPTFRSKLYFYAWIASIIWAIETILVYVFVNKMWADEVWAATVMFACVLSFEYWRDISIENWYSKPIKIFYWFLKISGCFLNLSLAVFWLWQIIDSKTIGEFGTPKMLPVTVFTILILAISIIFQFEESLEENGKTTWQASMISAAIFLGIIIIFIMIATPQVLFSQLI